MVKDYFKIENEVIIITGGSGKLGSIYSDYLAFRGANVFSFDILGNPNDEGKFGKDPKNSKLEYI